MKPLCTLLCACAVVAVASAQPVITSSSLISLGAKQTLSFDVFGGQAGLQAILADTGPNQTYDFSQFTYGGASPLLFELRDTPAGTPGEEDPILSTANYVFVGPNLSGDTFAYYRIDGTGYRSLGNVIIFDSNSDGQLDTTWTTFDPPQTFMVLPLMVGSEWTETVTSSTRSVAGSGSTTLEVHGEVEGWGDLVLPDRTLEALRVRRTTSQDVGGGVLFSFSIIEFKTNSTYQANISLDNNDNIQSANYGYVEDQGSVASEKVIATGFDLQPNYPNPFSQSTVIPFDVEQPGMMRLTVVDLLGREVLRPVDGVMAAGRHHVRIDGSGLTSGLYLYRLTSGSGVRVGQMVVQR